MISIYLSVCVRHLSPSHASVVMEAQGVQAVSRALVHVDDRPYQAVEFLGLMAQAGQAGAVVESGGLPLLQDSLLSSHKAGDGAMLGAATASLGRVALGLQDRKRDEVIGGVEGFEPSMVSQVIMEVVKEGKVKGIETVGAAVGALDWLATGHEGICAALNEAEAVTTLLDITR